jgi:hypothetical protein
VIRPALAGRRRRRLRPLPRLVSRLPGLARGPRGSSACLEVNLAVTGQPPLPDRHLPPGRPGEVAASAGRPRPDRIEREGDEFAGPGRPRLPRDRRDLLPACRRGGRDGEAETSPRKFMDTFETS